MNLPFSLPVMKEVTVRKKDESAQARAIYEQELAEYREALEAYKKCILEYAEKLDGYDKRSMDNQLSIVQAALDITYIKEQEDKSVELLEDIKAGSTKKTLQDLENLVAVTTEANHKLTGMDQRVVNQISDVLMDLQKQSLDYNKQLQDHLSEGIDKLNCKVRKNHTLLWIILIFNFIGLNALILMVLYIIRAVLVF